MENKFQIKFKNFLLKRKRISTNENSIYIYILKKKIHEYCLLFSRYYDD